MVRWKRKYAKISFNFSGLLGYLKSTKFFLFVLAIKLSYLLQYMKFIVILFFLIKKYRYFHTYHPVSEQHVFSTGNVLLRSLSAMINSISSLTPPFFSTLK